MTAPPSKLKNSVTAADGEQEFDEILSMSEDEFLTHRSSIQDSPPMRRTQEPIPANRIALVRQIEDEARETRKRQRLRDLGYKTLIVMALIVLLALISILVWMLYLALTNAQYQRQARHDILNIFGNHHQLRESPDNNSIDASGLKIIIDQDKHHIYQFEGHRILVLPRKMSINNLKLSKRLLTRKQINHSSSSEPEPIIRTG